MDFAQWKNYGSDLMNNFANNTDPSKNGDPFPEMIMYWNLYQTDEKILTSWKFFTYIDNLSFLGGLLDISLLIPSFLMIAYTFRINEINVFFYQQIMKNFDAQTKGELHIDEVEKLKKDPHTKYSKYIMDNYFLISFKVALAILAVNMKLPELYDTLKKKVVEWRMKKNVSDRSHTHGHKNKVDNDESDSDSDVSMEDVDVYKHTVESMNILKFVRKMNKTNS